MSKIALRQAELCADVRRYLTRRPGARVIVLVWQAGTDKEDYQFFEDDPARPRGHRPNAECRHRYTIRART